MKKYIILILFSLLSFNIFCQTDSTNKTRFRFTFYPGGFTSFSKLEKTNSALSNFASNTFEGRTNLSNFELSTILKNKMMIFLRLNIFTYNVDKQSYTNVDDIFLKQYQNYKVEYFSGYTQGDNSSSGWEIGFGKQFQPFKNFELIPYLSMGYFGMKSFKYKIIYKYPDQNFYKLNQIDPVYKNNFVFSPGIMLNWKMYKNFGLGIDYQFSTINFNLEQNTYLQTNLTSLDRINEKIHQIMIMHKLNFGLIFEI